VAVAALWGSSVAAAGAELKPNLQALQAQDLRVVTSGSQRLLQFSTTTKNEGAGALELRAGAIVATGRQRVDQRVYLDGGGYRDYVAGEFDYHPEHGHFHFENYARYELQPENAPGASQRESSKTTFCVMDNVRINTQLPGAPKRAVYSTCGNQVQGMSVGWGDQYSYRLAGQEIDVTGLPDGTYVLRIIVDPLNRLVESNDGDNTSELRILLSGDAVSLLDGKKGPNR
jgi:hypothetical protein